MMKLNTNKHFANLDRSAIEGKEHNCNPFANKDGSPIDGKEPEFFAWLKNKAREKFDKLPLDEQMIVEESERALNERMNS